MEQFNRDMNDLLAGKTVKMPTFNFKKGKREYKGNTLTLGEDDILVIEGIHGLNDRLSYSLSPEYKFKIYISALTQLNIDEHNRIPSTDGRAAAGSCATPGPEAHRHRRPLPCGHRYAAERRRTSSPIRSLPMWCLIRR